MSPLARVNPDAWTAEVLHRSRRGGTARRRVRGRATLPIGLNGGGVPADRALGS